MNVPHWDIEGYGAITRGNAVWLALTSLLVRREGKMIEVRPEEMLVGEIARGQFNASNVKSEVRVERIEDRPSTAL